MLWVLFALAVIELLVVHLFVALRWPLVGWPLTGLSALSIIWIARWIISWRRLPHTLDERALTLNMGRLRSITVPLDAIEAITPVFGERLKASDTMNLVPLAYPNRMVELTRPLGRRQAMRIAIRVDDPAHFDAAVKRALDAAAQPR